MRFGKFYLLFRALRSFHYQNYEKIINFWYACTHFTNGRMYTPYPSTSFKKLELHRNSKVGSPARRVECVWLVVCLALFVSPCLGLRISIKIFVFAGKGNLCRLSQLLPRVLFVYICVPYHVFIGVLSLSLFFF